MAAWPLKMGPTGCPKTSTTNFQSTLCNNPEEQISHLRHAEGLKSCYWQQQKRKVNWIGHILHRNCFPKHVIEGKQEGTEKRERESKQLLDDLKGMREYSKLKEEALHRTCGETALEEAMNLSLRQTARWINIVCITEPGICLDNSLTTSEVSPPNFNVLYLIGRGHAVVTARGPDRRVPCGTIVHYGTEHVANDSCVMPGERAGQCLYM